MKLRIEGAEIFVPDGLEVNAAMARTTHIAFGAHQDDIEMMAYHGVLECYGLSKKWFAGVTVTNGAGSPRDGVYADYTDADMQKIRKSEQKKAAIVGDYSFQGLLDYTSSAVKDGACRDTVEDIKGILLAAKPEVVYTHNLADKHDTHVSVALRVVAALRELPADARPKSVYGCEVWRDLDWMRDEDKVPLDVSGHENLAAALLGVYDSQIAGGKRYDLACVGRRRANATFFASHGVDVTTQLSLAMDLTPLVSDSGIDVEKYVTGYISQFAEEISSRLRKLR